MKLEVRELSCSYGDRPVLKQVSFAVPEGSFLTVLGPNGVGKSTLFRCILRLLPDYSGQVLIDGKDTRELSRKAFARCCAYIPQHFGTAFTYSVLDTVLMGTTHMTGLFSSPRAAEVERACTALEMVGISELRDRSFSTLSGGEQQLVMIARALSQQAPILLMDEPTSSLDYGNRERVLTLLRRLSEGGYTVILSTHDPQHALSYGTHALALCGGENAGFGSPAEVLTEALLFRLYGIECALTDTEYGRVVIVGADPVSARSPG